MVSAYDSHRHDLLPISKLDDLVQWASLRGWDLRPPENDFELLRLRRGRDVAVFHVRLGEVEHCTSWGVGLRLVNRWLLERRHDEVAHG
jgi:hypothetical protein